jgi:hypothetical protein
MSNQRLVKDLFLWSMAAIYLLAFGSLYVQIPGKCMCDIYKLVSQSFLTTIDNLCNIMTGGVKTVKFVLCVPMYSIYYIDYIVHALMHGGLTSSTAQAFVGFFAFCFWGILGCIDLWTAAMKNV